MQEPKQQTTTAEHVCRTKDTLDDGWNEVNNFGTGVVSDAWVNRRWLCSDRIGPGFTRPNANNLLQR